MQFHIAKEVCNPNTHTNQLNRNMKLGSYDVFHAFCCIGAMALIGRCIYLYILDEDITQVEYHKYHDPESYFYPSFSFCFASPFLGYKNFRTYFPENTDEELKIIVENYRDKFLTGKLFKNITHTLDLSPELEKYFQVDYDKVTKSLNENFYRIQIRLKNEVRLNYELQNGSLYLNYQYNQKDQDQKFPMNYSKYGMPTFHISNRLNKQKCYLF